MMGFDDDQVDHPMGGGERQIEHVLGDESTLLFFQKTLIRISPQSIQISHHDLQYFLET